jgi:hypothetical protein
MRINMQSNPLKYALESLKYAQYALLIQNMQVPISNNLKLGF